MHRAIMTTLVAENGIPFQHGSARRTQVLGSCAAAIQLDNLAEGGGTQEAAAAAMKAAITLSLQRSLVLHLGLLLLPWGQAKAQGEYIPPESNAQGDARCILHTCTRRHNMSEYPAPVGVHTAPHAVMRKAAEPQVLHCCCPLPSPLKPGASLFSNHGLDRQPPLVGQRCWTA